MAVGPYNRDPSVLSGGVVTATPARVLRRAGIRIMRTRGVRGRGRRR